MKKCDICQNNYIEYSVIEHKQDKTLETTLICKDCLIGCNILDSKDELIIIPYQYSRKDMKHYIHIN